MEIKIDIAKMTVDEKMDLIGEIWDSIEASGQEVPLTAAQAAELDRRSDELEAELQAGRPVGIPWEEAIEQIRSKHKSGE